MEIIRKIREKAEAPKDREPITIAFLGDSVTQGCFETYWKDKERIETIFDIESAYHTYVKNILCKLYPSAPVNIINAGISGDTSVGGLERLERDVLKFSPDLVVVAFGLNDSNRGLEGIDTYRNAMSDILKKLKEKNIEVIVLTTNMMCTKENFNIENEKTKEIMKSPIRIQNDGILDKYMEVAREVCEKHNCVLCDCYKKWKTLYENGVNTDLLLSNGINHPAREMNYMFANSLIETMFS